MKYCVRAVAVWLSLASAALAENAWLPLPGEHDTVTRIAFGSCLKPDKPQPIWAAVEAAKPELFVFLGDNMYADTEDPAVLREKYEELGRSPGLTGLRARTPVVATWDDHDYGDNDVGAEYPLKELSRQLFLDFWGEPDASPRRDRDGIYTSYRFGPPGQRLQLILLDLRYNRTPLLLQTRHESYQEYGEWARGHYAEGEPVPGPYARNPDPAASMLGERQWAWLEQELRKPADLRIIGSSLQVLADFSGWEAWVNFAHDHQRLIQLIRDTRAEGVLFISGDTHYGELSRLDVNVPYPLFDLTSSGLTETWHVPVPNALRQGGPFPEANFGLIEVDWQQRQVTLSLRSAENRLLLTTQMGLNSLRP